MSGITNLDVGNPRRPFSEDSAKRLYRALKDVEEALNGQDLRTRVCSSRYRYVLWRLGKVRARLRI